ncbi:hypothetical protein QR680_010091 [Steinernema hermaphroditum]|uniref:ShKT domain-containing protein n=1 Tax=Steinernema hermaphroditum TaxID=289476 RepID=A0AA39MA16_9BILA|nr:hypothetical protein QR680_010091 [Steinernema hermaphroditum]
MKISALYTVVVVSAIHHFCASERIDPLCDEYQRWEDEYKCGPKEYLIAYAKHYCYLFTEPDLVATFTPIGKKSVFCIRLCLLDRTQKYLSDKKAPFNATDCAELNRVEHVDFHPECYQECGFCKLQPTDVGAALFKRLSTAFCKKSN